MRENEKRIQLSTPMPGIGLEMSEYLKMLRNKICLWMVKPMAACKVYSKDLFVREH